MTTASTNATVANTSSATFQAWVTEVVTALVTTLGLTQTADTGQINPATVSLPGSANASAGYVILTFNDTLQTSSPIFIKLEFGTGSATTDPMMWITIGTGSNGSGTLNGTVGTRVAVLNNDPPISTSTNYTSRYCYNTTQGFLGVQFKQGAAVASNVALGGFYIFRSVNNSGAPTANSVLLLTNSNSTTGSVNNVGYVQGIDYSLSSTLAPATATTAWGYLPFLPTTTLEGTSGQIFPVFQWAPTSSTPAYGITNALAIGIVAEIALNATVSVNVLGSLTLTYIAVGSGPGVSAMTASSYGQATYTLLMLWQ